MARVNYNGWIARVYDDGRALPLAALEGWHSALAAYLPPQTGLPVLDLGSGTGVFSHALAQWFDIDVLAVEPADAMRREAQRKRPHPRVTYLAGDAAHLLLPDACCGGAWLSTVLHHIPDLRACAQELRRVLHPAGRVFIRSAFPGRLEGI